MKPKPTKQPTKKKKPKGTRWYDKDAVLRRYLDGLKDMALAQRNLRVRGVMKILTQECPHLVDEHAMEFPLDLIRRRWYDKEPRLWLLFNGLQHAPPPVLTKVIAYFRTMKSK